MKSLLIVTLLICSTLCIQGIPKYAYEITDDIPMGMYRAPQIKEFSNYGPRPEGTVINTIVIHYTECGYRCSWDILTGEGGVSSHYLV